MAINYDVQEFVLREKGEAGCCFEVIADNKVVITKHNNTSCFANSNRFNNSILNIYEPKANIEFSINEIIEYLHLLALTNLFLPIEFISDYSELEYKFVVVRKSSDDLAMFKGTYSVIRYLYGDGQWNNFDLIVKEFLRLYNSYLDRDVYSLLQIAHNVLDSNTFNSNHCLLTKDYNLVKAKDIKFVDNSMNDSYSYCSYSKKGSLYIGKTKTEDLLKMI